MLRSAGIAAFITAVLCSPRLWLWTTRTLPMWYLEAVLFLGSIVLWSFVFAWHTEYTRRPVFTLEVKPTLLALTTLTGIVIALGLRFSLDPILRARTPDAYPATFEQWIAKTLFGLAFLQLFLTFAPIAWLMRLFRRQSVALILTVLFGVAVLARQTHSSPTPVPLELFAVQLAVRIVIGTLSALFYLQGGVLLAWWWGLLLEMRHLLNLGSA